MATLALDPMIVAKINVLLASSAGDDGDAGFCTADILELFESFFPDSRSYVELIGPYTKECSVLSKLPDHL